MSALNLQSPVSHESTIDSKDTNSMDKIKKYKRISADKRSQLLDKIFFENKKIKKAAKELNLNYSSAKTILHMYRKKVKKPNKNSLINGQEQKICKFKFIEAENKVNFEIIATQGGRKIKKELEKFENIEEIHLKNEENKETNEILIKLIILNLKKMIKIDIAKEKKQIPIRRKSIIIKPIESEI